MNAFITATAAYLPGNPVSNEELDAYLGPVEKMSAKTRQLILATNGIGKRYYAVDPKTGRATHTNAQLAAEAIRQLLEKSGTPPISCLCCGTSSPDQLMPGHGSMVHGELGCPPCEVVSTAGICLTGITALKYGALSVALGTAALAVATGSELASSFLANDFFQAMNNVSATVGKAAPHKAFTFEAEFLRWMLSDGAGAALVEPCPAANRQSLRIEWIEIVSHADRLEPCMYAGAIKDEAGKLHGWRDCIRNGQQGQAGLFTVKQDARLLNREVIKTLVGESLPAIVAKHRIEPNTINWFLPHYSSEFFREPLADKLQDIGFPIPEQRWFTNLAEKGNTGSASFYIMLDELYDSGKLRSGDRILGMIPESGRFSVGYMLLTVV